MQGPRHRDFYQIRAVKRRQTVLAIFLALVCLSGVLSELSGTLERLPLGPAFLTIFSPLIAIGRTVHNAGRTVGNALFYSNRLALENEALQEEIARMRLGESALKDRIGTLNQALNLQLAGTVDKMPRGDLIPARVISLAPSAWSHTVLVDCGRRAGVQKNQTVITAEGLAGVVRHVSEQYAQVLLITDPRASLVVRVAETEELGVIEGLGKMGELQFYTEGFTRQIRRNFHLVTAGMDASLFPGELPVGTISEPARDKHGRITAAVSPAADFTRLNVLFILTGTQTVKEHRADEIP